ncbi:unnamed protein product, partial [Mesorhabditis spiculigera]
MLPSIAICILFATVAFSQNTDCLDGCVCDQLDAVIRCDHGSRTKLQIPETPLYGYKFIALTCNQIVKLPSEGIIKAAFPDIQGIDVQGNVDFACDQHDFHEVPILSDCGNAEPTNCTINKECDWKCASYNKMVELWKQFKEYVQKTYEHIVNEKGPEFKATLEQKYEDSGAKEFVHSVSSWFKNAFKSFNQ